MGSIVAQAAHQRGELPFSGNAKGRDVLRGALALCADGSGGLAAIVGAFGAVARKASTEVCAVAVRAATMGAHRVAQVCGQTLRGLAALGLVPPEGGAALAGPAHHDRASATMRGNICDEQCENGEAKGAHA